MKILVIDNYDSFTFNLVHILRKFTNQIDIYRNDKISPQECLKYDAIIHSPGPGIPSEAGNLKIIIEKCSGIIPQLGVCLGHQAIAEHLGGKLKNLDTVFHGIQSLVTKTEIDSPIFLGINQTFKAGRYHSWVVKNSNKNQFEVTAFSEDKSIMAIQNKEKQLYGIQFHPESILTPKGTTIIENFINLCKKQQS